MLNKIIYRCLMMVPLLLLGMMPAQAVTISEVEGYIAEGKQLRAAEFSPGHFAEAQELLAEAKEELAAGDNEDAREALDSSYDHLKMAMDAIQKLTVNFSKLVESRDQMQMADKAYLRKDLVERAERSFRDVVDAIEDNDVSKAKKLAKQALGAIRSAQVVALRKQYESPVSKNVSLARKVHAKKYAPKSFSDVMKAQKEVQRLIKKNPDAQVKMHAMTEFSQFKMDRAKRISQLGIKLGDNPKLIESLVDAEEARLGRIAKPLSVDLSNTKDAAEQEKMILQALQTYQQQMKDAGKTIATLSDKLAKFEGKYNANMAALRLKLQQKRDAEAKIKRLAKLFSKKDVEILLTPNSDVILRIKSLDFRSGSAVIAPKSYRILDGAVQAMTMFSKRAVRVEGHTDSTGASMYNQKLSERRADSVKAYLEATVSGKRTMKTVGFGEEKPIANNESVQGRKKNRRIDIVLLAPTS